MKTKISRQILSVFLCIALVMTYLPLSVMASAATTNDTVITDPGTSDAWEDIMGTAADGNRYAGCVWVDGDDLIAILGMKSRRVSRLSNMFETKTDNATGTAETSYAPEYNDDAHSEDDIHENSEVIVWLGNNGKLTLPVASGIKVTKDVTELADGGSANEKFPITVTIDGAFNDLVVTDANGKELATDVPTVSSGKTIVKLERADGESAVILGVTGGTDFTVT